MLWMLAILGCAALAQAQPQAPVVWGELRIFPLCPPWPPIDNLAVQGDTVVMMGYVLSPGHRYVAYTHDNGLSMSNWTLFHDPSEAYVYGNLAFGAGYVHAFLHYSGLPNSAWMRTSADGGITWNSSQQSSSHDYVGMTWDNWVYAVRATIVSGDWRNEFRQSANNGQSWSASQLIDTTALQFYSYGMARCDSSLIVTGTRLWPDVVYVARRMLDNGNWLTFAPLPNQPIGIQLRKCSVIGDPSTKDILILSIWEMQAFGTYQAWIMRSGDRGVTWEAPIPITDSTTIPTIQTPTIFSRGKYVGVCWADIREGSPRGLHWRFSPNHGRAWFRDEFTGFYGYQTRLTYGQFLNEEVRLYWSAKQSAEDTLTLMSVSGSLTPDTVPPLVEVVSLPPETVQVEANLSFLAIIADEAYDSLLSQSVCVRGEGYLEIVPMTWTGVDYVAHWVVPHEGQFEYRIEAEDFWENVGSYPDTGWGMFVTQNWIDAVDDNTPRPLFFNLSAHPNPFNARTEIRFALPQMSRATLTIYDLAGREVAKVADETFAAGEHAVAWNAAGLPSGVYFARLHAGEFAATRKLLLLR